MRWRFFSFNSPEFYQIEYEQNEFKCENLLLLFIRNEEPLSYTVEW